MLGPQWSKEELERFYEAYRKHGKDWKKVSSMIDQDLFFFLVLTVLYHMLLLVIEFKKMSNIIDMFS